MKSMIFRIISLLLCCFVASHPLMSTNLDKYFKMDIEELMEVKVLSSTKTQKTISDAPNTILSISADEIEGMGATTLSDILKMLPGFQILNRRNGRDMVWIRGVTTGYNTKVLLVVDGIPQREIIFGEWSSDEEIAVENIEHLEVIRGPGSALYGGNAYAGVISIYTKEKTNQTNVSGYMGNDGAVGLQFYSGKETPNGSLVVFGKVHDQSGYDINRDRKGKETDHTDQLDVENFSFKYLRHRFRIGINHNNFTTDYPLYATGENKIQTYKTSSGFADYEIRLGAFELNPKLYFYHTTHFFDYKQRDETGRLANAHERHLESLIGGLDFQIFWHHNQRHTLLYGFSYEQNKVLQYYEEQTLQSSFVDSIDIELNSDEVLTVPVDLYDVQSHYYLSWLDRNTNPESSPDKIHGFNYAAYVQEEISFFKQRLKCTLGGRLDKYEGFDVEISPRLGLVWDLGKGFYLKSLTGRAFKPPTYRQKYMVHIDGKSPGNPHVEPEIINTIEGELGIDLDKRLLVNLNYYYNDLSDFIESVNYAAYSNSPNTRNIHGFEVNLRTKANCFVGGIESVMFFANYSYTNAHDKIGAETFEVPGIAKHTANLGMNLNIHKIVSIYNGLNIVGSRNASLSYHNSVMDPVFQERDNKKGYAIWDALVQVHHFSRFPVKISAIVHNVLDTEHYNPTYDPDAYYDVTKQKRSIQLRIIVSL